LHTVYFISAPRFIAKIVSRFKLFNKIFVFHGYTLLKNCDTNFQYIFIKKQIQILYF
jgi:hypothetical protein